jgi:cytochrome c oxidase assembly protein subunit 11
MVAATENQAMVGKLLLLVGLMLAFCVAMVPLYRKICEVTGLNADRDVNFGLANSQVDTARTVTLELVAATNQSMPIRFEPVDREILVHPGQVSQIRCRVVNTTDQVLDQPGRAHTARLMRKLSLQAAVFLLQQPDPAAS